MTQPAPSEAGRTGDMGVLEGLPATRFGVVGDGRIAMDPGGHLRVDWIPRQRGGINRQSAQDEREEYGQVISRLLAEASERPSARGSAPDAYGPRISYLRDEAGYDGYELNESSERDFRRFVRSRPYIRKGDLVLLDNGNLRAVWRDEQGRHLGLQFLGGSMVQYVIFNRRQADQRISRVSGRDSLEGIARQIDAFELHSLLAE